MDKKQFEGIITFQNKMFPKATPLSKVLHLAKEVQELIYDLEYSKPNRNLEYADCFMLLYGAAVSDGMSYEDIGKAINEKMEINYLREWSLPDENGVVRHKK